VRTTLTCIAKLGYYFNPSISPEVKNCFYNKCEMAVLGKPQALNPGNRNWLSFNICNEKYNRFFTFFQS
jgi:hypothetical protein